MNIIAEKNIQIDNITIYLTLVKLYRGYVLFISDQVNFGLGSITLSTPPLNDVLKSTSVSYQLFGMEHNLLSKMIVEKAASYLKEPVILLFFLKGKEMENKLIKPIITLLNQILEEYKREKKN